MITIRSTAGLSEPALIGLEATLTTQGRTFTFSSNGPILDPTTPFGGGLFGGMSWPQSRFQLIEGVSLEQQMFVPHDGSAAALSWELHGGLIPAQLILRPYFSGCGPRNYRDVGFRLESQEHGGRLVWLPNVRGPRIIADTNGSYYDEPTRLQETGARGFANSEDLVAPGTFEFQLSNHPSVILFSTEGSAKTQRNHAVGAFLAGIMQTDRARKTDFIGPAATKPIGCLAAAA